MIRFPTFYHSTQLDRKHPAKMLQIRQDALPGQNIVLAEA
jgi:hypothetical protein